MTESLKRFLFSTLMLFCITVGILTGFYHAFAAMIPLELQSIPTFLAAAGLPLLIIIIAFIIALSCVMYAAFAVWRSGSALSIIALIASIILFIAVAIVSGSRMPMVMLENMYVLPELPEGMQFEELPDMEAAVDLPSTEKEEPTSMAPAAPVSKGIRKVASKAALDQILQTSNKPVVLKAFATWCGPCQEMMPIYKQVAQKLGDQFTFVELDVDNFDNAGALGISSLPTFIGYKNGAQMIKDDRGALTPQELEAFVMKLQ